MHDDDDPAALLRARIRAALLLRKLSAREVSLAAGLGATAIADILSGKTNRPRQKTIARIAAVLDLGSHGAEGIDGSRLAPPLAASPGATLAPDRQWLPAALAGDGALGMLEVAGDRMAPTLLAGDLVAFDTRIGRIAEAGLYALQLGGAPLVLRAQRQADGSVLLLSDNPAYGPSPGWRDGGMTVLGRPVWLGRRLRVALSLSDRD